jgi:Ser/Thr protein kinase RdoA (MazF antagonist)
VQLPSPRDPPDSILVNAVAGVSPEWPHATVRVRGAERIGIGLGLSGGSVHRVEADAERGPLTFVVKNANAERVERELLFYRAAGAQVAGSVPALLGGAVDHEADAGVLLLEDVAPAAQGDVLAGCTPAEAAAAVRSLARVHAAPWKPGDGLPGWTPRALTPEEWAERLASAADRFPHIVTARLAVSLADLPDRAARAIAALAAGPVSWMHGDAHLDNVLFRPDGTAVLLDWEGAVVGPPAIDVARMLTEGSNAGARADLAADLLTTYASTLASRGVDADVERVRDLVSSALVLLVRTAVGWAAREVQGESSPRMRALQENLLRSALAWETDA